MMKTTLGIIIGNRDFFPDHLITSARKEILELFDKNNIEPIIVSDQDTKRGGIETYNDAEICSKLFRQNEILLQIKSACWNIFFK